MPLPVISPLQSILGYLQWQAFAFQPVASNSPTSWTCTPIAPGLYFNSTTGLITGAAILPGVYQFEMTATNGTGTSDPVQFAMGIEASGFIRPSLAIDITIDATTRRVFLTSLLASSDNDSNIGAVGGTADDIAKIPPLFWIKAGDDLMLNIRFIKGGVAYSPSITALKFTLKEVEPESILISSTTFAQLGTGGESTSFLLYASLEASIFRAALANYEDPEATQFPAVCEIEWTETNTLSTPIVGPATLRASTRSFVVMATRDLTP